MRQILLISILLSLAGCATTPISDIKAVNTHVSRIAPTSEITESLFGSDTAILSNEAVKEILEGSIKFPASPTIAVLQFGKNNSAIRYYGWSYFRSEEYMDIQQKYVETLLKDIKEVNSVKKVKLVPKMMISDPMSLPKMREAAVRLQAHLLLIYNLKSDIFEKYRLFKKDEFKAYANCEAVLLDTRTGIIPFSTIVTKRHFTKKASSDTDINESRKRAVTEVSAKCLADISKQVSEFLNSIPRNL